jgi:hypothetical protein
LQRKETLHQRSRFNATLRNADADADAAGGIRQRSHHKKAITNQTGPNVAETGVWVCTRTPPTKPKRKKEKKKKRNGVMSFRRGHIIKIDSGAA